MHSYQAIKMFYLRFVNKWTDRIPVVYHTNNFDWVIDFSNQNYIFYRHFLVFKDRFSHMSREDLFVLTKLFETEALIDYPAILDEELGNGILRHITQLPVPPPKQIVLEKKPTKELKRPFNEPLVVNHPR